MLEAFRKSRSAKTLAGLPSPRSEHGRGAVREEAVDVRRVGDEAQVAARLPQERVTEKARRASFNDRNTLQMLYTKK